MRRAFFALAIATAMWGCGDGGGGGTPDSGATDAGDALDGGEAADAAPDAAPPECATDEECDDGNACNGVEACSDGACAAGTDESDGTACDLDMDAATRDLCVTGECRAARCGDGYVDATTTEQCDDGNDVLGDGCDDCRFTCEDAADCTDGNECDGAETCSAAHVCVSGAPLAEGAACSSGTGACTGGSCLARTCATAADCDDGNVCNGTETCAGAAGCAAGTTLDCDDDDACTTDTCAASGGCAHALIDADRDGHAPVSAGACGDDCDDTNRDVNPEAVDVCGDGIDNNCDGAIDEGATTTWYADCDADGYAAAGARNVTSCVRPAVGTSMCASGGGWTARAPASGADCNDANASINPGQTAFQTTAIAGAAAASDYDYDCNGTEEQRDGVVGSCVAVGLGGCTLTEGWSGPTVPECGASAAYVVRCERTVIACTPVTESRPQACR